jgi:hypothetical protein
MGWGVAYRARLARRVGMLMAVWAAAQEQPGVVSTDVPPERAGLCWYRSQVRIELGFRTLKEVGWQRQQTRRTEPTRLARHWQVLAVAMLWVLAYGTCVEDAAHQGGPPAGLRTPPPGPAHSPSTGDRQLKTVRLGLSQDLINGPAEGDRGTAIAAGALPGWGRGDAHEHARRLRRIGISGIVIDDRKGEQCRAGAALLRIRQDHVAGPRNGPRTGRNGQFGSAHERMSAGIADQDTKWAEVCDAAIGYAESVRISCTAPIGLETRDAKDCWP